MITIKKQKDIVLPVVKNFLIERGFEYQEKDEALFIKESNGRVFKIHFYFSSSGLSGNTLYSVSFKKVEEIIFEVGLPNIPNIQVEDKFKILSTIYDNENCTYTFTDRPKKIGDKSLSPRIKIYNEEDLYTWINDFKHYIIENGNKFINQYDSILDINIGLNNLEKRGEKHFSKLLLGGIDHLFRALIISKLCNDPKYIDRKERFDQIILQTKYEKWHPYYERLKKKLKKTKPIFNIDET